MCVDAHALDALSERRPVKKSPVAARSKKGLPKASERPKEDGKNETLLTGYSGSFTTH
jgi:hypothetical protein